MDDSTKQIHSDLLNIKSDFSDKVSKSNTRDELLKIRNEFSGKSSPLSKILSGIQNLDVEQKKSIGKLSNEIKTSILEQVNLQMQYIENKELQLKEESENIDVTLPGPKKNIGKTHIITQTIWKCEDIFQKMGFEIEYPNELDNDFYNFEAVNIPKDHPARDSWDTFWMKNGSLAITHTSSMQNRILSSKDIPIRVVVPGRCFRNENTDARHEHTFNQIEGIYVDKKITFSDMLGTLKEFFSKYYEKNIELKFTPDFFPFVEPGGMVSLSCIICDGKGCDVCKKSGWLEILGCGMIHPRVLEMANIDSKTYSGFAWGFGVERIIMLKYAIEDIRYFHNGNLDFISQF